MIDTGAECSLINTEIFNDAKEKYLCDDYEFNIKTPHGIEITRNAAYVPLPKIFNSPEFHLFVCFDFSQTFDGLFGFDLITKLGASLDAKKQLLITDTAEIQYKINQPVRRITPESSAVIDYEVVNIENGFAVFPEINDKFGKILIPESLVEVINNKTKVLVNNFGKKPIRMYSKSLELQPVQEIEENINIGYNLAKDKTLAKLQLENIYKNLKTEHLNIEEEKSLQALLIKYKHLFHIDGQKLTFTHKIKHSLNMKDDTPIYVKNFRQPLETKKEIKKQTLDLLRQDIIKESISPWNAPVHIVTTHKDGKTKHRMVVDFRRLNEKMIEDKYPIPNISDILDKLGRASYFSSLDLASGYHQVEMLSEDTPKTAFSTEQGHYEFKRMPFGLKNAPATFQRIMDDVLRGLLEDTCLVYLDDIIVYSSSLQEHIQKLIKVFKRLESANFKIKLEKCEFLKKDIKYLGHIITDKGVKPNPEKNRSNY